MSPTVSPTRTPVAGSLFRKAAAVPTRSPKRRKVLALIAAFADAGVTDPSIRELAGQSKLPVPAVLNAVRNLRGDGLLHFSERRNERNRYVLGKWAE